MKVLILNTVVLNTGDAAILHGVLEILHRVFGSQVQTIVFDSHADAAGKYYPSIDFRHPPYQTVIGSKLSARPVVISRLYGKVSRSWNVARFRIGLGLWRGGRCTVARLFLRHDEEAMIEEFRTADLVVSTGGTYFVENYALVPKIFDLTLAIDLGRPLVLFTQSLGPFQDPVHQDAVRRIVAASTIVLLRDAASRRHLLELGVSGDKLMIAPDTAFAMTTDPGLSSRSVHRHLGRLRVAISVRAWSRFTRFSAGEGMSRFKAAVGEATHRLVEDRGAQVTYLSTCQGAPAYGIDDSTTAREIVDALPPEIRSRVAIDADFHTPERLEAMLSEFDVALATRMHFAILAMMAGTLTVPISYEFKTTELFTTLELGHLVEDIETVTAASLLAKVDWLLAHRDESQAAIGAAVTRERARARDMVGILQDRFAPSLRT